MHNCKVSNANGHGVYVYLSDSPKVLKNKFDEICGDGIKLVKCSKGTVSGNTVNNVTFNPILDIDPLRKIARSGCGLLLSECEDTHIGSQISYNGSLYSGNTVSNCEIFTRYSLVASSNVVLPSAKYQPKNAAQSTAAKIISSLVV